jgi:dipeptidyl aminopeptidase/acylaminoacyl peptidase
MTTPLLSWTGGSDLQVNSFQSFEWYAALRKLKKENVFVVYPKEGHVLINGENQRDLTVKAMEWFDYYLKDGEKKEWMIAK